jgi:hypothetical protein
MVEEAAVATPGGGIFSKNHDNMATIITDRDSMNDNDNNVVIVNDMAIDGINEIEMEIEMEMDEQQPQQQQQQNENENEKQTRGNTNNNNNNNNSIEDDEKPNNNNNIYANYMDWLNF